MDLPVTAYIFTIVNYVLIIGMLYLLYRLFKYFKKK